MICSKSTPRFSIICLIVIALLMCQYTHAEKNIVEKPGLQGNWFLSSNTNQWVLGFYEKHCYFNGAFGEYAILEEKNGSFKVRLTIDKKSIILQGNFQNDSTITVHNKDRSWNLTNRRKRQSSGIDTCWDKRLKRADDTVRLNGYIGEPARTGLRELNVFFKDPLLGKATQKIVSISPEGFFSVKLPIMLPDTEAFINLNSRFESFVACPGDTIAVCFSPNSEIGELNEVTFGGTSGALNNEYNTAYKYLQSFDDHQLEQHMLKNTPQEAYRDYIIRIKNTTDSAMIAYDKYYPLSNAVKDILGSRRQYKFANGLLRHRMHHDPSNHEPLHPETLKLLPLWMANDSAGYTGGRNHSAFIHEMISLFPDEPIGESRKVDSAITANLSFADLIKFIRKNNHSLNERDLLMLDSLAGLAQYTVLKKNSFKIDIPGGDSTTLATEQRMGLSLLQLEGFGDYFQFYLFALAFDYKLKLIAVEYTKGYFRDYFLGHYLNTHVFSTHLTFLDDKLLAYLKTLLHDPVNYQIIAAANKIHEQELKASPQLDLGDFEEEEEGEW